MSDGQTRETSHNSVFESVETSENQSALTRFGQYFDDTKLIKSVFYGLIIGVGATLLLDYQEMLKADASAPVVTPRRENPVLPAFVPQQEGEEPNTTVAPKITTPIERLNAPMTIELGAGGILQMTGFIDIGTAKIFDEKIKGISEYIKSVELDSPGGSVFDAIAISSKIRELGWETRVLDGKLCASSCPIIFAGGEKRTAAKNAGIGVHQFYAFGEDKRTASEATSGTQATTARITRHLDKMEVDPQLWVHALETPPQQLYYFNQDELKKYKLTTP